MLVDALRLQSPTSQKYQNKSSIQRHIELSRLLLYTMTALYYDDDAQWKHFAIYCMRYRAVLCVVFALRHCAVGDTRFIRLKWAALFEMSILHKEYILIKIYIVLYDIYDIYDIWFKNTIFVETKVKKRRENQLNFMSDICFKRWFVNQNKLSPCMVLLIIKVIPFNKLIRAYHEMTHES